MLETLTVEAFTPHVGSTFRIALDDGSTLEAELESADAQHGRPAEDARAAGLREPFAIVLRGPAEPLLPQRIYRLEHAELGALELFLVPIAHDETRTRYEAVFG